MNEFMKPGRHYRAFEDFSLIPRESDEDAFIVRGTPVVFENRTCLYEIDGVQYHEIIDRNAFDGADMTDVIFNYNHGGKTVARLRNNTLRLNITDRGMEMESDLSGTAFGRELHEMIRGGYVDKMSFSFSVRDSEYDRQTRTRRITKIRKLYDVSAVDFPAYDATGISARSFFEEEHSKWLALEQASRRERLAMKIRTYPNH